MISEEDTPGLLCYFDAKDHAPENMAMIRYITSKYQKRNLKT